MNKNQKFGLACLAMVHIVVLLSFDRLAIEHLDSYGLIFKGFIYGLVVVNGLFIYEMTKALFKPEE